MTICPFCQHDTARAASCTVTVLHLGGRPHPMFAHGSDPGYEPEGRCIECDVELGGFHHPGCDQQTCPRCLDQLIVCDCPWDEFGSSPEPFPDGDGVEADPAPSRPPLPLGAVAAPVRARHHPSLRALATWCLARGRSCDLDVAALCLDALEGHRGPDGFTLDRPDVHAALHVHVHNEVAWHRSRLPEHAAQHWWSVVMWLQESGGLAPASAPLAVLLEPFGCAWGLDADGNPFAADDDIDFACQCRLLHDPTCPPGLVQRWVGNDPRTHRRFIVRARPRIRSLPPVPGSDACLRVLSDRIAPHHPGLAEVILDLWSLGVVDASGATPTLWLFDHVGEEARHVDPLAVDEHGGTWIPHPDRRRRVGFAWKLVPVRISFPRSGLFATTTRRVVAPPSSTRPGAPP